VLTSVGGWLYISAENAQLPVLTSVGGGLDISAENAQLPVLTSVGGWLYISAENAQLPVLTSVGGGLDISAGKSVHAPVLREIAGHALPDLQTATARVRDVAAAALVSTSALDMSTWHTCATTHCIAGWAIHQAGAEGYKLEKATSPDAAGAILLGIDAAHHFHEDNKTARAWLRSVLEGATAKAEGRADV
jgi:hypothetical protein